MPLCPKGVLMSGAPLLEVHGLRRAFGERVIIHDISFTLHSREIVFIRGASGVGKSLLLRALAHLDPIQVLARCKSSLVQNMAMKHAEHSSSIFAQTLTFMESALQQVGVPAHCPQRLTLRLSAHTGTAAICITAKRTRTRQQQAYLRLLQGGKTLLNGVPPEQVGVPKWRTQVQLP